MKNVSYNWIYIGFGLIRSLVSLPDPKTTVMRSNLHLKREVCSEEGDAEVFLTRLVTLDLHGPREGEEGKRSMKNITLILAPTDTAQVSMQSITVHIISFQQMASHTFEFLTKEHAGRMCPLPGNATLRLCFTREPVPAPSPGLGMFCRWPQHVVAEIAHKHLVCSAGPKPRAHSNDSAACFRAACAT